MSENGTIHITMMKNWVSHILFLKKRGAYRIPGSAEKGDYSRRTSIHPYSYPPPPSYDSVVCSTISNGVAVCGDRHSTCISPVQNRAARFFMGVG